MKSQERSSKPEKSNTVVFLAANNNNPTQLRAKSAQSDDRNCVDSREISNILSYDADIGWFTDRGASKHVSFRKDWFSELSFANGEGITLGNNITCEI